MKKVPSPTEIAVSLAKEATVKEIYILAVKANEEGKTLAEFIETLEVKMKG